MSGQSQFLEVENGRLCYEVTGSGTPIVLIHAYSFDMRIWDGQIDELAKTHKVVRYDLRGFGQSSLPESEYDHCADLNRLLVHLGIPRALLVGVSLGANIALSFAAQFPDKVSGLVLASSGLPGFAWKEQRPPEAAREYAQKHGLEKGKENWLAGAVFTSMADYPEALKQAQKMVADYSGWHWFNADMQAPSVPVIDHLEDIAVPTLLLSGARDVAGYREISEHLCARLPHAVLQKFATAGHMHNMEIAVQFNAATLDFMAQLDGDQ